jgi:predicted Holliday junction resolvase-like endonuclease
MITTIILTAIITVLVFIVILEIAYKCQPPLRVKLREKAKNLELEAKRLEGWRKYAADEKIRLEKEKDEIKDKIREYLRLRGYDSPIQHHPKTPHESKSRIDL